MGIDNGSPRAEQVTAGMEYFTKGAWRTVLTDAEVVTKGNGRRALFQVRGADGDPVTINVVAHSTVRARHRRAEPPIPGDAAPTT